MVEEYNQYMGGVDKTDQLLSYYGFPHRTVKWWRRAFFHLLDMAVVQAYTLYRQSQQSTRHLSHVQFRVELAKQLLISAGATVSTSTTRSRLALPTTATSGLARGSSAIARVSNAYDTGLGPAVVSPRRRL